MLEGYRVFIGAFIAAVAQVLDLYGITFDVLGVTNAIVVLGGLAIVVYGRLVARKPGPLAPKPTEFEVKP